MVAYSKHATFLEQKSIPSFCENIKTSVISWCCKIFCIRSSSLKNIGKTWSLGHYADAISILTIFLAQSTFEFFFKTNFTQMPKKRLIKVEVAPFVVSSGLLGCPFVSCGTLSYFVNYFQKVFVIGKPIFRR